MAVDVDGQYRVTAWVRTSGNVTTGQVGARRTDTQAVLGQGGFGPAPGYQQVTGVFNSGPNTLVQLFIGYTAPGADSWIQVDDVLVVPV